ncbi:putative cobalamin binding protein [Desulfosporosinus orientis DSM 765]|uniref:Putative cobalamin binding protein n=1 Tax=Desulfosporosinus orientis (strain ATCC 19365 / DSM 765 / NCIMB 8382 / VKM B-1628 / Singapore I) TaxID=768706 RepID=G7W8E5_DESOD|nr:corrinoid protein [Desulfosporosinus orientis]AET67085.1 putative cobalamin binding protein [Desulfosporosinus orientis DSM 765]
MSKIEEVKSMVEAGKAKLVPGLVQEAINEGNSAKDILDGMVESMRIIGDKFSSGEIFVPEMLMAAKAMSKGVDVLKPLFEGQKITSLGTCVIGTVEGDLHDIGKNLVSMMIGSAGFDMVDLGVDVTADKFVEAVRNNKDVRIVACSGLLTTTMPKMMETVQTLKSCGLSGFKVMVGGAPVSEEFAASIGADAFAPDAGSAAVKAAELASER